MTSNKEGFSSEFAVKLLEKHFTDQNSTKISTKDGTGRKCAELLSVFVAEAASRAAKQAENEDAAICEIEHVEKILPQLLLDF
uniref:Centromere protein X n=1 Tax=Ciona intestinalis TaxID=7719 RepID=H2Y0F9_CIOIN